MFRTAAFILCMFLCGIANAQATNGEDIVYELKGKIVSDINLPPHCGVLAFSYVIEFEVVEVSGLPHSNVIPVIVPCPEFYGENFFIKNESYTLKIADEDQVSYNWGIVGQHLLDKYHLEKDFYLVSAEKL